MSNPDDPFGRRDRTIIRPNPGGRRPGPGQGGAPPASAPNPPVSYPPPPQPANSPPPQSRQPPPYQPPGGYPPPPGQQPNWDGWAQSPTPQAANPYLQAQRGGEPLVPAPASPHIPVDIVSVASNPLMRAASSLLLLLGRLRASLSRAGSGQLMDQVAQSISQFENDAKAAGVATEQINAAKYALAATADDIVQNLPTDDRHLWTKYSMLVRFFGERTGGVRFFQELDRAKQNPALNIGLLEVMHACLSLGFEGVYRTSAGGVGTLQGIRRDIYETIRRVHSKTIEDLSPHWRGQTIALVANRFRVPVWSGAALACLILLGVYLVLRNFLSDEAEALALKMAGLTPNTELTIARETVVKPPPDPPKRVSTQLERIRAALADEIMAGKLSADQTATTIFVRIGNVVLFPSGEAKVSASFAPIAAKIAKTLEKEPGDIHVDGYSDTDPIKTVTFPSNWELSEARAKSVAAMLKPGLSKPERVIVAGKGSDNPIAPNDTPENKSKNRRVEISIPRAD
ncbi:MAG TPA: type VI secretion system protein TssL, long form [Roseiarcus sp.]|nr:type VI secretion system protein TssL, long form [Roseiarcus sp.]